MDKKHNCDGVMEKQNKMREIEIEKIVVSCGCIDEKLDRSVKLLGMITGKKVMIVQAKKRIPTFGISPGKKAGCKVTIRDKEEINKFLKRFFSAISNKLKNKSIAKDHFSFGIKEYIEVPGLEYKRDIGILGFKVDVAFKRKGKRVKMKKIKQVKYPEKQKVTKEEIIEYLTKNLEVSIDDSK
jgi:large subunit ribosomal protein L5